MLQALSAQGFLVPYPKNQTANTSAFLRPKSASKAAFIADLRGLNLLTPHPLPTFHLPNLVDIGAVIALHPPATLWGTTIDITNFFWSLKIPPSAHGMFRIKGLTWPCLPFGWNLSPAIAQSTLGYLIDCAFVAQGALPFWNTSVFIFHYYDDILLLSSSQILCTYFTTVLTTLLHDKGLLISAKSALQPSQTLKWIGKVFNLVHRSIHNSEQLMTHTLAIAFLTMIAPVHKTHATCHRLCPVGFPTTKRRHAVPTLVVLGTMARSKVPPPTYHRHEKGPG